MTAQSTEDLIDEARKAMMRSRNSDDVFLLDSLADRLAQLSTPDPDEGAFAFTDGALLDRACELYVMGGFGGDASRQIADELIKRVRKLSTPVGGDARDKIAVIIATSYMNPLEALADENEFGFHESSHDIRHKHHSEHAWKRALVKADAILALSTPASGGWRPIESAPRDGTRILLTDADGAVYGGYWEADCGAWAAHCGQPVVRSPEPLRWMPLPASPSPAEEGK